MVGSPLQRIFCSGLDRLTFRPLFFLLLQTVRGPLRSVAFGFCLEPKAPSRGPLPCEVVMSRRMQLRLNAEVGQRGNAAAPRAMRGGLFAASSSSSNDDEWAGRDDGDFDWKITQGDFKWIDGGNGSSDGGRVVSPRSDAPEGVEGAGSRQPHRSAFTLSSWYIVQASCMSQAMVATEHLSALPSHPGVRSNFEERAPPLTSWFADIFPIFKATTLGGVCEVEVATESRAAQRKPLSTAAAGSCGLGVLDVHKKYKLVVGEGPAEPAAGADVAMQDVQLQADGEGGGGDL